MSVPWGTYRPPPPKDSDWKSEIHWKQWEAEARKRGESVADFVFDRPWDPPEKAA